MLSCLGNLSRNKAVGIKLAKGESIEKIIKNSKEVAEGVPTLLVLGDIIKEHNLEMPIMETFYHTVKGEITLSEAQNHLMKVNLGHENRKIRV